jgi:phage FluMu gp28-like protein
MSRNKYTTEVLGEFLSSDGLLFTNIEACISDNTPDAKFLYMGIDFAAGGGGDYTVLSVFNESGQMVGLHYTNNLPPMQQVEWLANLINDYGKSHKLHRIYAEENSIGKVYVDALRSKIVNARVTAFTTTNESKQEIVTEMQIALEQERVKLLRDPRLLDEMRRFEATVNPKTKKISYGGHIGTHDDCVMATLIAHHAYCDSTKIGKYNITFR